MTNLQFSLFFVALLVGYIMIHLRLARFETHLREISHLKLLNERLKGVADHLEGLRLDRIEEGLSLLHEDLEQVRDATLRVERSNARAYADAGSTAVGAGSPGDRIRSAIESRLLGMGYGNLRILADLSDASLDDELEILVECDKDHMPSKGRVITRNGSIQDVQLQSVAGNFT